MSFEEQLRYRKDYERDKPIKPVPINGELATLVANINGIASGDDEEGKFVGIVIEVDCTNYFPQLGCTFKEK